MALREESYVALETKRPRVQSVAESDLYSEINKQLTALKEQVAQLSVGRTSEKREAVGETKIKTSNTRANFVGNRNPDRVRGHAYGKNWGPSNQYTRNINPHIYDPTFQYSQTQTQNRDQGCWYCGDPNHFKRDCPHRSLNH